MAHVSVGAIRNNARLVAALVASLLAATSLSAAQENTDADRERLERVADLFVLMGVKPGLSIADVGSSDGFYSVRLARAVGAQGKVYAVDISADALQRLKQRAEREGLANIETVKSEVADPKLPADSLDLVLIRNAYHEMTDYAAMLEGIFKALRAGGVLTISEPIREERRKLSREQQTKEHEIAIELVEADLKAAGFEIVERLEEFTNANWRPGGSYWVIRARRS